MNGISFSMDTHIEYVLLIEKILKKHRRLLRKCENLEKKHEKILKYLSDNELWESEIEIVADLLFKIERKAFEPIEREFESIGFNLD